MDFKISKVSINKYLVKPLIIALSIDLIAAIGFTIYLNESTLFLMKWFLIIVFIQSFIFYIPLLTFFSNYYKVNKGVILTIVPDLKKFIYFDGKKNIVFFEYDIESLRFYTSIPVHKKKQVYLFWLDYYYCVLETSKGSFVITCLLCEELDQFVQKAKIIRKGYVNAQGFPPRSKYPDAVKLDHSNE